MREIDLPLPAVPPDVIPDWVETTLQSIGLMQTQKSSLRKYPGCTHWHYKCAGQPGTLDLTYWPKTARLWAGIHTNREGGWMDEALDRLKTPRVHTH